MKESKMFLRRHKVEDSSEDCIVDFHPNMISLHLLATKYFVHLPNVHNHKLNIMNTKTTRIFSRICIKRRRVDFSYMFCWLEVVLAILLR